jgi:serine/threonine protein kinase
MIELRKFFLSLEDYDVGKQLGKGGCGEVYLATERKTGAQVALKVLFDVANLGEQRSFIREVTVPLRLNFPGIVKLIGFRFAQLPDPTNPGDDSCRARIATELMPNGDLAKLIADRHKKIVNKNFGPTEFSKVIFGVASIMAKVHKRSVIHRDLKPLNIFIDEQFEPKIADFGLSKVVSSGTQMTMTIGTPICMAPELFADSDGPDGYDNSVDVYAYGMMIYQIFSPSLNLTTGPVRSQQQLMMRVMKGTRFVKPEDIPEPLWLLITECWDGSPGKRPTFAVIVERMLKKPEDFVLRDTNMGRYREYQARINIDPPEPEMPDTDALFATAGPRVADALTVSALARTNPIYMNELNKSMTRSMAGGPEYKKATTPWNFRVKPGRR